MVTQSQLDSLRSGVVLSDVIRKTLALQRAGQEWKACCPFHEEQTPSFIVNDLKGFYHCFGCGAHGDAIRWLTEKRSMSFDDAIKYLNHQTNIRLIDQTRTSGPEAPRGVVDVTNKRGGGKLSRSETVTVRLDPKLNYLCELAARAQRRTKSSYIEWAIADSLKSVVLSDVISGGGIAENETISDQSSYLWHVDEADRLAYLALIAPTLLTHEEQVVWKLIKENGYLWRGSFDRQGEWCWEVRENTLIKDRLRENWANFNAVASGEKELKCLPSWNKKKKETWQDDLDDDIPF